jgi:hypothetical protein
VWLDSGEPTHVISLHNSSPAMVSPRVCLRVERCGPDVGHLPGAVRGVDMGHDRGPNVMALILEIRTER